LASVLPVAVTVDLTILLTMAASDGATSLSVAATVDWAMSLAVAASDLVTLLTVAASDNDVHLT
jgi:hypothetical protein